VLLSIFCSVFNFSLWRKQLLKEEKNSSKMLIFCFSIFLLVFPFLSAKTLPELSPSEAESVADSVNFKVYPNKRNEGKIYFLIVRVRSHAPHLNACSSPCLKETIVGLTHYISLPILQNFKKIILRFERQIGSHKHRLTDGWTDRQLYEWAQRDK